MGEKGFTLIEILIVVGIIALLASTLAFYAVRIGCVRAHTASTVATQDIVKIALSTYYSEFLAYPPDGYDEPVFAPNGRQLKGSACLTFYLAWLYPDDNGKLIAMDGMITPDHSDPDKPRKAQANSGTPYWRNYRIKRDFNKYGEILDGFGNPMRYDNCESGYTPNPRPIGGASDPDPRETENNGRPFHGRSYDLWSCGPDGGTKDATAHDDITSE